MLIQVLAYRALLSASNRLDGAGSAATPDEVALEPWATLRSLDCRPKRAASLRKWILSDSPSR